MPFDICRRCFSLFRRRAADRAAAERARVLSELRVIRARKRSYCSQLSALDSRTAPGDAAALYARERLGALIAAEVARELDLLDRLDAIDGVECGPDVFDRYAQELHTENELEAAGAF